MSSANLAQLFIAQLTEQQIASHREAGRRLIAIKDQLFAELSADLRAGRDLDEYQVQQHFVELILQAGLIMPEGEAPIVAVNANRGIYITSPLAPNPVLSSMAIWFSLTLEPSPYGRRHLCGLYLGCLCRNT